MDNVLVRSVYFIQRMHTKYSKKDVKIYIKINIKSAPTCCGLNNHHQAAVRTVTLSNSLFSYRRTKVAFLQEFY